MMKDEQITLLIREGEGLTVEFKEKYSSRIDEDIVAFAKEAGISIGKTTPADQGGLPKGLTQKALGRGISIRRNELIADLFSRLHKVERAGTGIRRMRKSLAEAGLGEPEFEINGFFRAVFHRSMEFSLKTPQKILTGLESRMVHVRHWMGGA